MSEQLKPCPFCGRADSAEISRYRNSGVWWYYVECIECMACGPVARTETDAMDAWNFKIGEDGGS